MAAPTRGGTTAELQITTEWVALTDFNDAGGAPITSYRLEWDAGTAGVTWSDVVGHTASYLGTDYTITTGVVAGVSYRLRVSAYNAHGYGAYSPEVTIVASAVPDRAGAPTTVISGATNVAIAWTAADPNSAALDAYQVWILTSDGATYAEDTAYCGADIAALLANLACELPLTALRAAPYNLAQGDLVTAKVRAHNNIGWSAYSDPTDDATAAAVEVEPHALAAVTRGSTTSTSQVHADWVAPTGVATGGSAVDSLHLQWDFGTAGVHWYDLQGGPTAADYSLLTTHTVTTGVVAGTAY
jgi:hypothetical protein